MLLGLGVEDKAWIPGDGRRGGGAYGAVDDAEGGEALDDALELRVGDAEGGGVGTRVGDLRGGVEVREEAGLHFRSRRLLSHGARRRRLGEASLPRTR
jgi:hypothetical protein